MLLKLLLKMDCSVKHTVLYCAVNEPVCCLLLNQKESIDGAEYKFLGLVGAVSCRLIVETNYLGCLLMIII